MLQRRPIPPSNLTAFRAQSELFSWLGTVLLAFNLFAAAALPGQAVQASEIVGAIEICSADGMVWIDTSGKRVSPNGQPAHGVACQFCLPLLHAGLNPSPPPALPAPQALIGIAAFIPAAIDAAPKLLSLAAQPRAPPIL